MNYTGYTIVEPNDRLLEDLYKGGTDFLENFEVNEYIIVMENNKIIDVFRRDYYRFEKVLYPKLGADIGAHKSMKPLNPQQYCAMDMIKNKNIPLKLVTGRFGSGKSMMFIVAALDEIRKGNFDKIIFVRNNVQVANTDPMGALPGGELDKMLPYAMPFADHCGGVEGLKTLIEREQLEVVPLAYLRGRSIRNSIIYSMESENLTKEHIQLLMGRVDSGSQLWLDADPRQRDKQVFTISQGIETMVERLKGHPLFGYIHLLHSERSDIAKMADLLD